MRTLIRGTSKRRAEGSVLPANDDTLGVGIESGVLLMLFAGIGYLIDRQLNTLPIFIIVFLVVGAVGVFAKLKVEYTARMDRLEDERRGRAGRPT
ncbi:MAG: hypothetical protein CSA55_05340 [Ilumatobacter coccineus]|uniref:ATP synthase protein I n=1 Tax=Ilumatobacter coccineus TaxID=467094 RepID=A0A2G6K9D7_9ACTN|nr:MAG: hypothetical protein CSA55_05340 [Ilumatobacter coccineus]